MGRQGWCIHAVGRQTNMLSTKGPNETKMLWVEQPLALALCFQVTEGEGYPEATQTRRVRRLLGEVLQLPGEQAADGILTVTCHPLICLSRAHSTLWSSGFFFTGHAFYYACVIGTVQLYDSIVLFLALCLKKTDIDLEWYNTPWSILIKKIHVRCRFDLTCPYYFSTSLESRDCRCPDEPWMSWGQGWS